MKKTSQKLQTRQWRLKDYLDAHRGQGFISIEQICEELPEWYKLNTNPYNHDKCAVLSQDVRDINWNVCEGYQIIIKDAKGGIKYAETQEEFEWWLMQERAKVEVKYQYLNNLKWKANQDGLMPVINKADKPVDFDHLKEVNVFKGEN